MRAAMLACFVGLSACATGASEPPPVTMPSEVIAEAPLPDYKPETAAACNAVPMRVALAADGTLNVNGEDTNFDGLAISAGRKNDACLNAPATVMFSAPVSVTEANRQKVRDALVKAIVNISIIETNS